MFIIVILLCAVGVILVSIAWDLSEIKDLLKSLNEKKDEKNLR